MSNTDHINPNLLNAPPGLRASLIRLAIGHGYTSRQIAAHLGVSHETVRRWHKLGLPRPTLTQLFRIFLEGSYNA